MNHFFDFHCHPGLKRLFRKKESRPSPWQKLKAFANLGIGNIELNPLFNEVLDSQASLQQLYDGNVNLIGLVIHAPESNMSRSLLEKDFVQQGKLSMIDPQELDKIAGGQAYYQWAVTEIGELLSSQPPTALPNARLKFIQKYSDYDPNDLNTIHAFVVVEGVHTFSPDLSCTDDWETLLANFRQFISNPSYRVFVINPVHIQQNRVGNHAHGIQFFHDDWFYPHGDTLTEEGKRIIREIYSNNILVDIKHMGLMMRMEFYRLKQEEFPDRPILCTHAGINGLPMSQRTKYPDASPVKVDDTWKVSWLKPKGHVPFSFFNCCSINLYDEDILQVIGSGGMIGISLDQRILGFGAAFKEHWLIDPTDTEYISAKESKLFFGTDDPSGIPVPDKDHLADDDILAGEELQRQAGFAAVGELHLRYFFNNVIHILRVANAHGYTYSDASEHICIGSDFDGLIDAIDCCKTTDKMGDFYELCRKSAKSIFKDAGFKRMPLDPDVLVTNIFYENGRRFLEKWF